MDSNVYDSLLDWNKLRIVKIEKKIHNQLHNIKTNIMVIGELLSDAKKILSHGKYKPWIEEIFGDELPYSTASCYKKIYEDLRNHPDTVKVLPVSFLIHMNHVRSVRSGTPMKLREKRDAHEIMIPEK